LSEYRAVVPKTADVHPSRLFAAFSDPTRLRLLLLLRAGELCVCDLVDVLRLPQPTVSRHLAALRRASLVTARKQGLWSYYALSPDVRGLRRELLDCLASCAEELSESGGDGRRLEQVRKKRGCCD
jgi:ArsR family transcriptional regulator, arsenate/arsenite/antimonite-responsive transcriptional repressor